MSALGGLSLSIRASKRSHPSTLSALGRLSTSIRVSKPLPPGVVSVLDGSHTSNLGRAQAFGLPEAIRAIPASQHLLLQRSFLATHSRPRSRKKRRKRQDQEGRKLAAEAFLLSCFNPTTRPLLTTSPAFSSAVVAFCNAETPGSKLHDERCADVREAYRTLRFLNATDPEAFHSLLDSNGQLSEPEAWRLCTLPVLNTASWH